MLKLVRRSDAAAEGKIESPSASVLSTSTVFPDMVVMMSPGLVAEGPGMFSVRGVTVTMLMGIFIAATAIVLHTTAAAPPMSAMMRRTEDQHRA